MTTTETSNATTETAQAVSADEQAVSTDAQEGGGQAATDAFAFLGNLRGYVEKARVSCQVHLSHLVRNGTDDPFARQVFDELVSIEDQVEAPIQAWARRSRVYQEWGRYVKGCGPMLLGAIMTRTDIRRVSTVSAMWAHFGFAPGQRRRKGQKLDYDPVGRTWCWRLGSQFLRYDGSFRAVYDKRKAYELAQAAARGQEVVPARKGQEVDEAKVMTQKHVHNRALRYTIKLFLACLWLKWRAVEGLPVTDPYITGKTGSDGHQHTHVYKPEDFMDR